MHDLSANNHRSDSVHQGMRILEGAQYIGTLLQSRDVVNSRCLAGFLNRRTPELEEGCLFYLACAWRRQGVRYTSLHQCCSVSYHLAAALQKLQQARQYLELGIERHPQSKRIAEELRNLRGQTQKGVPHP
jgi:hypothetical protein